LNASPNKKSSPLLAGLVVTAVPAEEVDGTAWSGASSMGAYVNVNYVIKMNM
jgi:hypothetical protein